MEKYSEFIKCYCPHCGNKVEIKVEKNGKYGGIIGGAISGAMLGSNIGIAAGPLGAIAGTIPGLIIGALLGENVGAKLDDPICESCKGSFKIPKISTNYYQKHFTNKDSIDFTKKEYSRADRLLLYRDNYTYFKSFISKDYNKLLEQYSINEFDCNFKNNFMIDISGVKIINDNYNKTTSLEIKRFKEFLKIFDLNDDYFIFLYNELSDNIRSGESNMNKFLEFLNLFRKKYVAGEKNPNSKILSILFSEISDKEVYWSILKLHVYFLWHLLMIKSTCNYLNEQKVINFNEMKEHIQKVCKDMGDDLNEMRDEINLKNY